MKTNIEFEIKAGFLMVYVSGEWNKMEIINFIPVIRDKCKEQNKDRVLVDLHKITASVIQEMDRFYIGEALSKIIGSKIKIAALWEEKYINRFAETVALNRGARFKVFSDPDKAEKWLLS
jgi:hypothetical protein